MTFTARTTGPFLQNALQTVFPDRDIVEIPDSDPIMHSFFDLDRAHSGSR